MDFFYDQQQRRLVLQVIRTFGGFVVKNGKNADGEELFRQVPVRYGETSRMVNQIIRQHSENKILYTPFMAVHIISINMSPERRQNPFLVRTDLVDERKFNDETQEYEGEIGDRFKVKRHMPVPYDYIFQLDMWCSNVEQKFQLTEQIMMLFNPAQKLQSSDNALDWTAITDIEMVDAITWSSRSIPFGTDETIDVASMQFRIPYWINPPAELTKRRAIETIIVNIRAVAELPEDDSDFSWEQGDLLAQIIITPNNHILEVEGDTLTLLNERGGEVDEDGNIFDWENYIRLFGDFRPGETRLIVKRKFGDPTGVTGTLTLHPTNVNQIIWTVDPTTLPANIVPDITAIIDPLERFPGDGTLAAALTGQRYLLVSDMNDELIGSPTEAWGSLNAAANDIIEFNGTDWIVTFNSSEESDPAVVLNLFDNKQFRWDPLDQNWVPAVDGLYRPGTWKVIL